MPTSKNLQFENAGFYLLGLILLAILGFWDSYFSQLFIQNDYNFYFHFHAIIAFLWILTVITQPMLIKWKRFKLHRQVGKFSYVLFALIFISVLLLVHNRHSVDEENLAIRVFVPFKDLIVIGVAYFIAIKYRKQVAIHSRAMIATGLVFIEPAMVRMIRNFFNAPENGYLITIGFVYTLLIVLMILERKQKNGRWVFPLILLLYVLVHSVIIFGIPIGFFGTLAKWFLALPLT